MEDDQHSIFSRTKKAHASIISNEKLLYCSGKWCHVLWNPFKYNPPGTVEGKGRKERQRKSWTGNIKKWIGHGISIYVCVAEDREWWMTLTDDASTMTPLGLSDDMTGWCQMLCLKACKCMGKWEKEERVDMGS